MPRPEFSKLFGQLAAGLAPSQVRAENGTETASIGRDHVGVGFFSQHGSATPYFGHDDVGADALNGLVTVAQRMLMRLAARLPRRFHLRIERAPSRAEACATKLILAAYAAEDLAVRETVVQIAAPIRGRHPSYCYEAVIEPSRAVWLPPRLISLVKDTGTIRRRAISAIRHLAQRAIEGFGPQKNGAVPGSRLLPSTSRVMRPASIRPRKASKPAFRYAIGLVRTVPVPRLGILARAAASPAEFCALSRWRTTSPAPVRRRPARCRSVASPPSRTMPAACIPMAYLVSLSGSDWRRGTAERSPDIEHRHLTFTPRRQSPGAWHDGSSELTCPIM